MSSSTVASAVGRVRLADRALSYNCVKLSVFSVPSTMRSTTRERHFYNYAVQNDVMHATTYRIKSRQNVIVPLINSFIRCKGQHLKNLSHLHQVESCNLCDWRVANDAQWLYKQTRYQLSYGNKPGFATATQMKHVKSKSVQISFAWVSPLSLNAMYV